MRPDCSYAGGTSLGGTGLDFSSDGSVVKASIAALKFRNPNTKVLVAVGGATYTNFDGLNENAIAQVVNDFGFDGVDIDFEPNNPGCTSNGQVTCQSDQLYIDVVTRIRNALPRPAIVTTAGWSVGAYGEGQYASAEPTGSAYMGLAVNMLRAVGGDLDWINMMSYDASSAYDPTIALQAYQSYYSGKIAMGVEVPPEAWGGHVLSISELESHTDFVNNNGGAGMMLWSLHKPNDSPSDSNPSAQMIADTVCPKLGLSDCGSPLFPQV